MYDWAAKKYPKIDFGTAFRLSEITGVDVGKQVAHARTMQLMIPNEVAMDKTLGEQLGLKVRCEKDWRELPDTKTVNYKTAWPKSSIRGESKWVNPTAPSSGCWGFISCFGGHA